MRICLVTPDIVGPIKNGGIGTYAFNLTKLLHESGHELTIVFTSVPEKHADPNWREWFDERSIQFYSFEELPEIPNVPINPHWEWFMERSWRIYSWLKNEDFDLVHFQDWGANGFYSIQAKSTGLAFSTTRLCVTLHSPTQWCTQGMAEWPESAFRDLRLNYCEQFCAEYADHTISPSQHMLDWIRDEGWVPRHDNQVLQNPFFASFTREEPGNPDLSHIIFFGRLEFRKGVSVLCAALNRYYQEEKNPVIKKVTFIGKEMKIDEVPSKDYIKRELENIAGLEVEILTSLDTFGCLDYIRDANGIVIIPSLLDNFPYTLVECITQGIPLFCSDFGGMAEICDPKKLFSPNALDLTRIFHSFRDGWVASAHKFDADDANRRILEWHNNLEETPCIRQIKRPHPRISVVISYYNHAPYLQNTLDCLLDNNLEDSEVVVINDGSTNAEARTVFQQLSKDPRYASFIFLDETINRGLGGARNFAIKRTTGDWLLFHDSDNCAQPFMLDDFRRAISVSDADVITCHYQSFTGEFNDESKCRPYNYFRPYGNFTAIGLFENIFGDANFAVRKRTFLELGGFTEERNVYEDWNFLVKAAMNKKEILVMPKIVYWYRRIEDSMVRTLNNYTSHMNVLESYLNQVDPTTRILLRDLAIPLYHENYRLGKAWGKLNRKLQKLIMKQVPRTRVSRPPRKFWQFKFWK